jgi:hypothetical protein
MSTAFAQYVVPSEDGTYLVYDNNGNVAKVTRDRAYAFALAQHFARQAHNG